MREKRMLPVGALPDGARLLAVLGGMPAADGIPMIGPEALIVPFQSVGDNVLLGTEAASGFFPRRRDLDRRATDLLDQVGLSASPGSPILDLDPVDQRIVELARALAHAPEVLLVDDRSVAFDDDESSRWAAALDRAADVVPVLVAVQGLEDLHLCERPIDAVIVVRNGDIVGSASPTDSGRLMDLLVGSTHETAPADRLFGPVVLELRDVSVSHPVHRTRLQADHASLTVRAGEIVGLVGAPDLILGVFGASSGGLVTGTVLLDGHPADLSTVESAIASRVLFISEHPPAYDVGLIGGIPTSVSGEKLARLARMGMIDSRRQYFPRRAPSMILNAIPGARSAPSTRDMNEVLRGWAANPPRVALVTEPFAGLSRTDRDERRELIERIAAAGAAVVLEAGEAVQLAGLSHRIIVQRGTRLAAELTGPDATLRGLAALSIRTNLHH